MDMSDLDIYSVAIGLHHKDRMSGVMLWDVGFVDLEKSVVDDYKEEAKMLVKQNKKLYTPVGYK